MSRSIRQRIPFLVLQLVAKHAAAWAATSSGHVTYQYRRGLGYFIIIRTRALGAKRLVSARVMTRAPSTAAEWKQIREQMLERGLNKIADAKHRYLIVPRKSLPDAQRVMRKTTVKVLAND